MKTQKIKLTGYKYSVKTSHKFDKELRRSAKRGQNIEKLLTVVKTLASGRKLPEKNQNHKLSGNYANCFECHIEPDWLLIYQIDDGVLVLTLLHLGSHSDLFKE